VLKKWFFCINERGFDRNLPLIAVAVLSARTNTDLRPVCIYNGANEDQVAALSAMGVEVLRHRSFFEDDLRAGYGENFDTFSGHWLRVDLPLLEKEEEVVLYTDTDVMFLAPPVFDGAPPLLAASPEFDLDNHSYFSSGVMILNLPRLRELHDEFMAAIRHRLHGDFRYPAHDQESFNRFFGPSPANRMRQRAFTPMAPENNWKPFWGPNERAAIIHFHGPKPVHARLLAEGEGERLMPKYKELWLRSPEGYETYSEQWDRYLEEARPRSAARVAAEARRAAKRAARAEELARAREATRALRAAQAREARKAPGT
jgi:hypothetical protein